MTEIPSVQQDSMRDLAIHLAGTHKALISLAKALGEGESKTSTASAVQWQLEWAASHLHGAMLELKGGGDFKAAALQQTTFMRNGKRTARSGLMEGLKGHSQAIAIPEILGFVSSLRKSGLLRINSTDEGFLVQLEDGSVVYAQGDNPPDEMLLGNILVSQGALTGTDLKDALSKPGANHTILGRSLLAAGSITKEQLCIALAYQVQTLFHRMYVADDAVFQFDESVKLMAGRDIQLNVTSLLLDSARATDEDLRAPDTDDETA